MQTNTRPGPIPMPTAADLTGKTNRLVVLLAAGLAEVSAISDRAIFLLTEVEDDANGVATPFTPDHNRRVNAKGAGNRGDALVLADPAVEADKGKLRVLPAAAGTYHVLAIAEEDFEDGQDVRVRPVAREEVVVV